MDDTIRQDLVASQSRWMTQASLAAQRKLVLSHTGLITLSGQFSNKHGREGQRAAAPDSVVISQPRNTRRNPNTVEDLGTIVTPQVAALGTRAAQGHQDQQLARSTILPGPANYETPQILKLTHSDKTATMVPMQLRPSVSAAARSAAQYAEGGGIAPTERTHLAALSRTVRDGTPRHVSVTMGPLQKPQRSRPALRVAEKGSDARVAPEAPGVPHESPPTPDEAPTRPGHFMTSPPDTRTLFLHNLAAPFIKRAPFSTAPSAQRSFAPIHLGQNDPAQTAPLRGEAGTPGQGTPPTTGYSPSGAAQASASAQGEDLSTSSPPSRGPTEGDVYLDGTLVGRWMARALTQAAARQPSSGVAFDPTRSRLPVGTMIGV